MTREEQKLSEMSMTIMLCMSGIEENIANDIASNIAEFMYIKGNPLGYHKSMSDSKRTNSYLYGYFYGLYKANAISEKQMAMLQDVADALF